MDFLSGVEIDVSILWIVALFAALVVMTLALTFALIALRRCMAALGRLREQGSALQRMKDSATSLSGQGAEIVRRYAGENRAEAEAVREFAAALVAEARKGVDCGSAAYFAYDRGENAVRLLEMDGLFPSCISISEEALRLVAGRPEKVEEYLRSHAFKLNDTPFAAAVEQINPKVLGAEECQNRIRFRVNDLWSMLVLPVRSRGQVCGVLVLSNRKGGDFEKPDRVMGASLAQVAGVTLDQLALTSSVKEKAAVESQIGAAVSIQSHLLPKTSCLKGEIEAVASYKTAYRLGGDYYDFIDVDENHLGVLVADVSGKGIPAGLVMAATRTLMAVLSPNVLSPARLLTALNGYLYRLIPETMFVTASYAVVDVRNGEMVCALAGHEPFLAALGEAPAAECHSPGMVLGILDNEVFASAVEDRRYVLGKGDTVLFYTDGAVEALNARHEEFTPERLMGAFESARRLPSSEILQFLGSRIERFVEGAPAYDDVTMVVLRRLD